MKFLSYVPHPVIIGVLALLMMYIAGVPAIAPFLITWIAFQTWALYFLAGGSVSRGVKAAACYVGGMIAAIVIMLMAPALAPALGMSALPITVGIIATLVIFFEKVSALDFIPAWFVGAGAYFGYIGVTQGQMPHTQAFVYVLTSAVIGLVWGFFTVFLRGKYQAWLDHRPHPPVVAHPAK
ncbi:MAG: DUF1097 domain-containing protein [Anaerolineae bacterium]